MPLFPQVILSYTLFVKISAVAERNASTIALKAMSTFDGVGIFGVELFLLNDESVLLNEIAPR